MQSDDGRLTRTERRWNATHLELLDATVDELLGNDVKNISANSISRRADRAAGTFFNHFESIDDAIAQALEPVAALRDEAVQILATSGEPSEVLPIVLGTVLAKCASSERELLAMAAARELGFELPGTGPLSAVVIDALGGPVSPGHLAYTTRLVAATIDHIAVVFSRLDGIPPRADLERAAWNLITTATVPSPAVTALVDQAVEYAEELLRG